MGTVQLKLHKEDAREETTQGNRTIAQGTPLNEESTA